MLGVVDDLDRNLMTLGIQTSSARFQVQVVAIHAASHITALAAVLAAVGSVFAACGSDMCRLCVRACSAVHIAPAQAVRAGVPAGS